MHNFLFQGKFIGRIRHVVKFNEQIWMAVEWKTSLLKDLDLWTFWQLIQLAENYIGPMINGNVLKFRN